MLCSLTLHTYCDDKRRLWLQSWLVLRLSGHEWVLLLAADAGGIASLGWPASGQRLLWSLSNSLSIRNVCAGHVWRGGGVLWAPGSVWAAPAADAVPGGIGAGLPDGAAVEHRQLSQHLRRSGALKLPLVDAKP